MSSFGTLFKAPARGYGCMLIILDYVSVCVFFNEVDEGSQATVWFKHVQACQTLDSLPPALTQPVAETGMAWGGFRIKLCT